MPSVYSRLSSYLTPEWFLIFFGSYLTYRLLRRFLTLAHARTQLRKLQETKANRLKAELDVVDEAIKATEHERVEKEAKIVTSSAVTLVQKMASGTATDADGKRGRKNRAWIWAFMDDIQSNRVRGCILFFLFYSLCDLPLFFLSSTF